MKRSRLNPIGRKRRAAASGPIYSTFRSVRSELRRCPLNQQSSRVVRERPSRNRCVAIVRRRAGGNCQLKFSPACRGYGEHAHEVWTRAQFPELKPHLDPDRCLFACDVCNGAVESEPERAAAEGVRFSRKFWFNELRHAALVAGMWPALDYGRAA